MSRPIAHCGHAAAQTLGEQHGIRVMIPPFKCCKRHRQRGDDRLRRQSTFLAIGVDDRGHVAVNPKTVLPRLTRKGLRTTGLRKRYLRLQYRLLVTRKVAVRGVPQTSTFDFNSRTLGRMKPQRFSW